MATPKSTYNTVYEEKAFSESQHISSVTNGAPRQDNSDVRCNGQKVETDLPLGEVTFPVIMNEWTSHFLILVDKNVT